jgi:hypothetical protein
MIEQHYDAENDRVIDEDAIKGVAATAYTGRCHSPTMTCQLTKIS